MRTSSPAAVSLPFICIHCPAAGTFKIVLDPTRSSFLITILSPVFISLLSSRSQGENNFLLFCYCLPCPPWLVSSLTSLQLLPAPESPAIICPSKQGSNSCSWLKFFAKNLLVLSAKAPHAQPGPHTPRWLCPSQPAVCRSGAVGSAPLQDQSGFTAAGQQVQHLSQWLQILGGSGCSTHPMASKRALTAKLRQRAAQLPKQPPHIACKKVFSPFFSFKLF